MFLFSVLYLIVVVYSMMKTRQICFFSPKVTTDNEKMILAAMKYLGRGLKNA